MRRFLTFLLALLLLAVLLTVAGLWLAPDRVEQVWLDAGLPPRPIQQARQWLGRTPTTQTATVAASPPAPAPGIRLSGVLETRQVYAMSEIAGRAAGVWTAPGDPVTAGQTLVTLDDAQLRRDIAAAEAAVAAARAAYQAAAAPPRPERVAVAAAGVTAAETALANARRALAQAEAELARPLAIAAEIDRVAALLPAADAEAARHQALIARLQIELAQARTDGSREGKFQQQIFEHQLAAAAAAADAAAAHRQGLQRSLTLLRQMRSEPLALQVQVRSAARQVALTEAALAVAQAEYTAAAAPPTAERVAVAAAEVQRAEAALALARWPLPRTQITAPITGRVQARLIEPGETIAAGVPLIALADAAALDVRVFVAEQDLHRLVLGDQVWVETVQQTGVQGVVTFIAAEAQFRPTHILDPEERGNIVFLARLRLPNPDGSLKAGMPVEVLLPADAPLLTPTPAPRP